MEIEDAFTEEAIGAAGVDVGGEYEDELRESSERSTTRTMRSSPEYHENVAVLCFVAGRAYQERLGHHPSES